MLKRRKNLVLILFVIENKNYFSLKLEKSFNEFLKLYKDYTEKYLKLVLNNFRKDNFLKK